MTVEPLPQSAVELAQEAVTYDIPAELEEHWERMELLRAKFNEAKTEFEVYKERWKEILDKAGADRVRLRGQQVATHSVSGALNESKLKKELPHVWMAYSKEVTERKLDRKKLLELDPQTYENFRPRSLVFTDGGPSH